MVSFSRGNKGNAASQANNHRTSVASNLTTQSTKAGSHNSFIVSAAKRVVSAFDPRASWATTTSATMDSVDENTPTSSLAPPTTVSEPESANSAEGGKRGRNYGPKIQAMLAMFEHKGVDASKEHREIKEDSGPEPSPKTDELSREKEHVEMSSENKPSTLVSIVFEEKSENEAATDVVPPLAPRGSSTVRKLRSMTSKIDLVKREKSVKEKRRAKSEKYKLDNKIAESWNAKVEALADWAEECVSSGRMPDFEVEIMQKANDLLSRDSICEHPTEKKEDAFQLLTPEQDLLECFSRSSCHPHLTAYFAKILREAKRIHTNEDKEKSGFAKEVAMSLVYHPCRVPLVFRIEAVHLLVQYGWPSDMDMLLQMAWQWCHKLELTSLVLNLMVETQKLWAAEIAPLEMLVPHEHTRPEGGYAVKDRTRCV